MIFRYLLGFSALLSSLCTSAAQDLDIHLHTGTFRGVSIPNGDVEKWLGIPFAEPPIGELRFKAPVAIAKRSSSAFKNATTFGNACPQLDGNLGAPMSEDCLFLNVCIDDFFFYAVFEIFPMQVWRTKGNSDRKLPVVFWIHVSSRIRRVTIEQCLMNWREVHISPGMELPNFYRVT